MSNLLAAASEGATYVDIDVPAWAWPALLAFVTFLLLFDLLVIHRKPHVIHFKEAAIESAVWVAIGLTFGVVMAVAFGGGAGGEYLAGYLIEKSLSIDNVFVWAVLLSY